MFIRCVIVYAVYFLLIFATVILYIEKLKSNVHIPKNDD